MIRQSGEAADPRLEIVTLQTGSINELGGRVGYCPQLSPDNRTIAIGNTSGRLELLDARSGETLLRGGLVGEVCAAVGWSPDGRLLVNDDGSTVIDAHGRPVTQLRHRLAVNSGMSWSPDGRSILLYSRDTGRYSIRDVANGSESFLQLPPGALRPLGWAGDRVVWLAGRAGDQSLISTDVTGTDPRPWMRVDAGDRPIETVQWSRDLSGRPSDER